MKTKKLFALALAVLMLLSLCACGSKGSAASRTESAQGAPATTFYGAESGLFRAGKASDDYDSSYAYEPEAPMAGAEEAAFGLSAASNTAAAGDKTEAPPSAGDIAVDKIIYSASATVETTDFDGTVEKLEALIAQYGGFVESSSVSGNNYYRSSHGYASQRSADYRIRIPSRDFGTVMNSLSTLGNVPYSNTYTENITSQYYDSQARLEAFRTQEKSLLEMMEKAETVEDLLKIQDHLTDVRYRIESLQSTLTNWDRQVSYSTISLSVQEVQDYTPEAKLSFGQQLSLALSRGLNAIGEFFRDLPLWLLEALPALLVLAVIVVLAVLIVRRIRRRARARREKAAAPQSPDEPKA